MDRTPPHPPAALLLDMDGVIVHTEERWDREERRLMDRAGAESVPRDAVKGISVDDTYDILAQRASLDVDSETYADWYDEVALTEVYPRADLLPGVFDLIADLRAAGVPVAVVSSSMPDWIDAVLDRIDESVDTTVSSDTIDRPGKPEPGPYEVAAERLGVDPADCVAVEDSETGIAAATAAGAYTIGFGAGPDDEDRSAAHERVEGSEVLVARLRDLTGT